MSTDWLAACWFIFYMTLLATLFLIMYTCYEYEYGNGNRMTTFIDIST